MDGAVIALSAVTSSIGDTRQHMLNHLTLNALYIHIGHGELLLMTRTKIIFLGRHNKIDIDH